MKKGDKKCSECGEIITADKIDNYEYYLKRDGKVICEECYEGGIEYASSLVKFTPDGPEDTVYFDDDFNYSDGDSIPEPIERQKWVSTDAWRGYTTWEYTEGFKEIADGWVTGYPDETTHRKRTLGEMFDDLKNGDIVPPCDIYWVFGHTSNVFSQSSAIIIHEDDEQLIKDWLDEINGGVEGLQNDFN